MGILRHDLVLLSLAWLCAVVPAGKSQERPAVQRTIQTAPVLAHYPPIALSLDTPALSPGRTTFTTQAELEAFCEALAVAPGSAGHVSNLTLGTTPGGRKMLAMLVSKEGAKTPADMAKLQNQAGLVPYLQSGEVQWWYFPKNGVGMPFYDAYTAQQFQAQYGVPLGIITSNTADPSAFLREVSFLPTLIGAYTSAIRTALQAAFPACRHEILYPTDTNSTALNRLINYPAADWTPAACCSAGC